MDIEQKKRMREGRLYDPADDSIITQQRKCLEKLYDFNLTRPHEVEKRDSMLKDMLAECGENCYIERVCKNVEGLLSAAGTSISAMRFMQISI